MVGYKLYPERDLKMASVLQATALEEGQHLRALGLKTPIAVIPSKG